MATKGETVTAASRQIDHNSAFNKAMAQKMADDKEFNPATAQWVRDWCLTNDTRLAMALQIADNVAKLGLDEVKQLASIKSLLADYKNIIGVK
jgi:hypothetical protein